MGRHSGNALCAIITKVQDVPPAMCDTVDHEVKAQHKVLLSRSQLQVQRLPTEHRWRCGQHQQQNEPVGPKLSVNKSFAIL